MASGGELGVKESQSSESNAVRLSVVIPVYNECGNVESLTQELHDTLQSETMAEYRPFEVLFVDDGSTDGTRDVLSQLADQYEAVRVVYLRRNFGQSAALTAGMDTALGEVVVTMDGDRQNDPADIPRLLEKYKEGFDCVSGWRRNRSDPVSKRLPSRIQTHLAKLTGPEIHDFGCTLKVYDSDCVRDIDIYGEGHRYIPAMLHKRGYRISEVEVNHRPRTEGNTKYGWKRLLKGSLDLLFHIFWNRFSTKPLHLFGGLGLLFLTIGGAIGAHAVFVRYVLNVPLVPRTPRLLLVLMLVFTGLQLFIFGVVAEMLSQLYYDDRRPYGIEAIQD